MADRLTWTRGVDGIHRAETASATFSIGRDDDRRWIMLARVRGAGGSCHVVRTRLADAKAAAEEQALKPRYS